MGGGVRGNRGFPGKGRVSPRELHIVPLKNKGRGRPGEPTVPRN